jgi:hypothetical protein
VVLFAFAVGALVSAGERTVGTGGDNPLAANDFELDHRPESPDEPLDQAAPPNQSMFPFSNEDETPLGATTNISPVSVPLWGGVSFGGPPDECETADRGMGCKYTWAPDKWCNVGAGVRTGFTSTVQDAPSGGGNFFHIDNVRLYTSGKVHEYVGFEFNTDINENFFVPATPNVVQLLDAIAKFEFNDYFNVWAGRLLPPSDRANLSGPYFINAWDFPFVQNYPGIFAGRDSGVVYWGQYGGGKLQWSVGAFDGTGRQAAAGEPSAPNGNGNIEFAMRIQISLLDPEPGYYKQGSYYGEKNLLVIGYALQTQDSAVGNAPNAQHATEMNGDLLCETKMSAWGSATIEGALYHYTAFNPAGLSLTDPFVARPGDSGFIYAGWLLPQQIGIGRFRPFARYQKYNHDNLVAAAAQSDFSQGWDVGCEYAIKAQSARLMAFWGERDVVAFGRVNLVRITAQVNF